MDLIQYFNNFQEIKEKRPLFYKLLKYPRINSTVQKDFLLYKNILTFVGRKIDANVQRLKLDLKESEIFEVDALKNLLNQNILNTFKSFTYIDNDKEIKEYLSEKVEEIKKKEFIGFLFKNYQEYYKSLKLLKEVKSEIKNLINFNQKIQEKSVYLYLKFIYNSIPEINVDIPLELSSSEKYNFLRALFYNDLISDIFMYYSYPFEVLDKYSNEISEYLYIVRLLTIKLLNTYLETKGYEDEDEKYLEGYIYNKEQLNEVLSTILEYQEDYKQFFILGRKYIKQTSKFNILDLLLDLAYLVITKDKSNYVFRFDIYRNYIISSYLEDKTVSLYDYILESRSLVDILSENQKQLLDEFIERTKNSIDEENLEDIIKNMFYDYEDLVRQNPTNMDYMYNYSFLSLIISLNEVFPGEIERSIFSYTPYLNNIEELLEKLSSEIFNSLKTDLKEISVIDSKLSKELLELSKIFAAKIYSYSVYSIRKEKYLLDSFTKVLLMNMNMIVYLFDFYLKQKDFKDVESIILYKILKDILLKGTVAYILYLYKDKNFFYEVKEHYEKLETADVCQTSNKSLLSRISYSLSIYTLDKTKFNHSLFETKDFFKELKEENLIKQCPLILEEKEDFSDEYNTLIQIQKIILDSYPLEGGLEYVNYLDYIISTINGKSELHFNPYPIINPLVYEKDKLLILEDLLTKEKITKEDIIFSITEISKIHSKRQILPIKEFEEIEEVLLGKDRKKTYMEIDLLINKIVSSNNLFQFLLK